MGLLNAVNRFDVETGSDFLSFAVPTMMGEVRRHFRDHGWAVKVPRRLKDLQKQFVGARGELSQRLGRAPTASEIADYLDIDRELVVQGLIASSNYSTRSTDVRVGSDGESRSLSDTFGDVDHNLDTVIAVETVRPLIAALPDRQRDVLRLRFFENLTQTQIAERVGCSQMHVSRLIARALQTIRNQVGESDLAATTLTPRVSDDRPCGYPNQERLAVSLDHTNSKGRIMSAKTRRATRSTTWAARPKRPWARSPATRAPERRQGRPGEVQSQGRRREDQGRFQELAAALNRPATLTGWRADCYPKPSLASTILRPRAVAGRTLDNAAGPPEDPRWRRARLVPTAPRTVSAPRRNLP